MVHKSSGSWLLPSLELIFFLMLVGILAELLSTLCYLLKFVYVDPPKVSFIIIQESEP